MRRVPDRPLFDRVLVYSQYLWLPLLAIFLVALYLVPDALPWVWPPVALVALGIGTMNAVSRKRWQAIADAEASQALEAFLRPGEALIEHAMATRVRWIYDVTAYLDPIAYLALTSERLLVVGAHMGLHEVKPTKLVYESPPGDADLHWVRRGRLATRFWVLRGADDALKLAFRRGDRRRAARILDALPAPQA